MKDCCGDEPEILLQHCCGVTQKHVLEHSRGTQHGFDVYGVSMVRPAEGVQHWMAKADQNPGECNFFWMCSEKKLIRTRGGDPSTGTIPLQVAYNNLALTLTSREKAKVSRAATERMDFSRATERRFGGRQKRFECLGPQEPMA